MDAPARLPRGCGGSTTRAQPVNGWGRWLQRRGRNVQPWTITIRDHATRERLESISLEADSRDAALFEVGRLIAAYWSGVWEFVGIEAGWGTDD